MKVSPWPIVHLLQSALRRPGQPIEHHATRTWVVAPGQTVRVPSAYFLPGQLERIRGWVFCDEHPGRDLQGGFETTHGATRATLIQNAWLVDGVLYHGRAALHLVPRKHRMPRVRVDDELAQAAMACTPSGNRWFGMWLLDDCPRYALAQAHGLPVTTDQPVSAHAGAYERWLEIAPMRVGNTYFRELILFDDSGQNAHKRRRFGELRARLRSRVALRSHPGVFILRGFSGEQRVLGNELELAERLSRTRGLTILDPLECDVPRIVAACAGARLVVGVEGSALAHAMMCITPGSSVLTLQPPKRFCSVYKHVADRESHRFGFVVGTENDRGFDVSEAEVERTLDLLAK